MQKTALRLKAAVYIRVSTSKQEKWSPDAQKRVLLEHCERMGWEPTVYSETGSGETLEGRPQIQKLLKDAAAGQFSLCLVVEQERLSRDKDLFDWLVIVKTFRDAGVQIATPSQTYNLADSEDAFLTNLFGVLAAREKHKMIERTQRGRAQAKAAGKYLNEWVSYGWMIRDGRYVLHPEESERVKLMVDWTRRHSCRYVGMEFNRRGYPTKTGKRGGWQTNTVLRILKNRALFGELHFGEQVVQIPAILSKAEWVELQERLRIRRREPFVHFYLLKGLLFCSTCGRGFYGRTEVTGGRLYRYYVCCGKAQEIKDCTRPAIRGAWAEEVVWGQIKTFLKTPKLIYDALDLAYQEKGSQEAAKGQEEGRLTKQMDSLTREETRLVRAYYSGNSGLSQGAFQNALDEIRRDRLTLEQRQKEVAETEVMDVRELVSLKDLKTACAEIAEGIEEWDADAQREVLSLLVDRVTVQEDQSLTLKCKLPMFGEMKPGRQPGFYSFQIRIPANNVKKRGNK